MRDVADNGHLFVRGIQGRFGGLHDFVLGCIRVLKGSRN